MSMAEWKRAPENNEHKDFGAINCLRNGKELSKTGVGRLLRDEVREVMKNPHTSV